MGDKGVVRAAELVDHLGTTVGKRISSVVYYGLDYGPDEVVEWDFGEWHWPEFGVEFTMDDGTTYSALWGDAFSHFDLEFLPQRMSSRLHGVGDPGGPRVWDVTDHRPWHSRVGEPITAAEIVWMPGEPSDENPWQEAQAPIAVWLSFSGGEVWIVAAEPRDLPPTDRFYLGQNEVIVVFTAAFAASIGLPVDPGTPSKRRSDY